LTLVKDDAGEIGRREIIGRVQSNIYLQNAWSSSRRMIAAAVAPLGTTARERRIHRTSPIIVPSSKHACKMQKEIG